LDPSIEIHRSSDNQILLYISELHDTFQEVAKRPTRKIEDIVELNPLGPYLAKIGNPLHPTTIQQYLLQDNCLNYFKQQSVDKANRIVYMIEKHTAELEKAQAQMTQVKNFIQRNALSCIH